MTCIRIDKFDHATCKAETLQNRSLIVHELWNQFGAWIFFDFLVLLISKIMWIISINNNDHIYGLLTSLLAIIPLNTLFDLDSPFKGWVGLNKLLHKPIYNAS